ncbi:acyltransferase family protein [Mucilaginibacter sp.]
MILKKIKSLFTDEINSIPPLLNQSYYHSLNGFRAIGIFIVLAGHCVANNQNFNSNGILKYFADFARTGVVVFFVLSGFLITTLLLKEKISTKTISLKSFYIRRALRILPVAYTFILIVILLNTVLNLHIHYFAFIAAFLFFVNFIMGDPRLNWDVAHYWSLSVEEQYYLFFPWMVKYLNRQLFLVVLVIVLVCIGLHPFFDPVSLALSQKFLAFSGDIYTILIGSLFSIITFKGVINIDKIYAYKFPILVVGVTVIVGCHIAKLSFIQFVLTPVSIALIIISNIKSSNDIVFKFLNNRLINKAGILSYSIYIWQEIFTFSGYNKYFRFPLNLILIFAVGYISYNFYEKRFLRLKSRFTKIKDSEKTNEKLMAN